MSYNLPAPKFREYFTEKLEKFSSMLTNVNNFKSLVSKVLKLENFRKCIENIQDAREEYRTVAYNALFNKDQLHKMRISHDTLLEYAHKLIDQFDLLKKIIIDKYPYIFIDEFQDTNEKIISIMALLEKYSNETNKSIFIGYFGDTAQNIYNDGIGNSIYRAHPELKIIKKDFNRRSTKEVVEVINKIRNDEIIQKPIFEDCEGGSVKFYTGESNMINVFLDRCKIELGINATNKLNCLVLTNETLAEYSGFDNLYQFMKATEKYSGINYNQINTELLSNEESKRGEIPNLLIRAVRLKNIMNNGKTPILEILAKRIYQDITIYDLKVIIDLLKKCNGNNLSEYLKSISNIYSSTKNDNFKELINTFFDVDNFSYERIESYLSKKLFPNLIVENIEEANGNIIKLLEISMEEYNCWYKYIMNDQDGIINFYTYHGTKGLEFDNIAIIMKNGFGREKEFFNFFFENYEKNSDLTSAQKKKFEKVKNLLYVSCSRAKKNIRILYTDDTTNFNKVIIDIFGYINQL